MFARSHSLVALTALAALSLGSLVEAQVLPTWNRGIESVSIVHPPGTPPGTYDLQIHQFATVEGAPVGTDLSREIVVEVNGLPFHAELDPLTIDTVQGGPCQTCNPNNVCGNLTWHNTLWNFHCGFIYTSGPCGCGIRLETVIANQSMTSMDMVRVTLNPTPGSAADFDTSDDSFTFVVGEHDPATTFCAGDGTLPTPCPCGNSGASGHGCGNSQNASGAFLAATGFSEADPITGTDSVVLHGSGMPASVSAIYLKSDASNPAGTVFGDGVSCLTGSLIRLRTKINVGGASQFPEPGDPSVSVRGATPPGSGLVGHYAVYYRNAAAAFCPPATYNISNALSITW